MKATITIDLNHAARILYNASLKGDTDEFFTTEYTLDQALGRDTFQKVFKIFKEMKQNNK